MLQLAIRSMRKEPTAYARIINKSNRYIYYVTTASISSICPLFVLYSIIHIYY